MRVACSRRILASFVDRLLQGTLYALGKLVQGVFQAVSPISKTSGSTPAG